MSAGDDIPKERVIESLCCFVVSLHPQNMLCKYVHNHHSKEDRCSGYPEFNETSALYVLRWLESLWGCTPCSEDGFFVSIGSLLALSKNTSCFIDLPESWRTIGVDTSKLLAVDRLRALSPGFRLCNALGQTVSVGLGKDLLHAHRTYKFLSEFLVGSHIDEISTVVTEGNVHVSIDSYDHNLS